MLSDRSFKDHFSGQSSRYRACRPDYPDALFTYLAELVSTRELAWDCGAGSGQASAGLACHFERVVATDASTRQVESAPRRPRVHYAVCTADQSPLPTGSVDLVVVAQALHWFPLDAFYQEVQRVLRPDSGWLAAWTYDLLRISPEVDRVVDRLYHELLRGYWPAERRHVDERYRALPFPFEEARPPAFQMEAQWDLERLTGFLQTWSGAQRFKTQHNADPVDLVTRDLAAAWGDPVQKHQVHWPLTLRAGRLF